ncbi:lipopolysaccharide export system permease protein [Paracoccus halophilus]|uniref:Permease n=1 Tax=Paracoccus halophilus TaxID=376733 RepID=A0A099F376_9RHOB|nr:LPS export ABC transporter permease LptF [Paracoccus halophilus]KGJ05125.1 permease [Paracoccus halophilus]SFA43988.1 lipopolysaccharide export system permease protein [Paracoccus halophilus]
MPRIDRYILSQFLTLFGFFALVLVSVYWINRAVSLFENLISDGQTALVVLEFTALTLPLVISIVLPIAAFAASAYGTNRLASESELVAMQAAGISPWRLARPVLAFGVMVGVMVAVLVHSVVPMARGRLADRQAEISQNVTAQFLRAGAFQYPVTGVTLYISKVADDGRLLYFFLEDARDPNNQTTYTATEALVVRTDDGPRLVMMQGMVQNLRQTGGRQSLSVTRFGELAYDLDTLLDGGSSRNRDLRAYSTSQLMRADAELLAATGSTADKARAEAHQRLAKPFQSPVAALLGFAMLLIGGYSRFGVWKQVIWAVVALILVQFLGTAAESQVAQNATRWPLIYLPPLVGAAICATILWVAAKPRRLRKGAAAAPAAGDGS